MEKWKDVTDFVGYYQVSSLGRVRTVARNHWNGHVWHWVESRIIKPSIQNNGYYRVQLTAKGIVKYRTVHRMVAEQFVVNPNAENLVNHIDENKLNNISTNLEWVSKSDNNTYLMRQSKIATKNKENGVYDRLREKTRKPVLGIPVDSDNPVIELDAISDGKRFGFDPSSISEVARGKRKTHKGYIFSFK